MKSINFEQVNHHYKPDSIVDDEGNEIPYNALDVAIVEDSEGVWNTVSKWQAVSDGELMQLIVTGGTVFLVSTGKGTQPVSIRSCDPFDGMYDQIIEANESISGVLGIVRERIEAVFVHGWTPDLDDINGSQGEFIKAAFAYLYYDNKKYTPSAWPFPEEYFKPGTTIKNLEKAGQFISAEIDRLKRAEKRKAQQEHETEN